MHEDKPLAKGDMGDGRKGSANKDPITGAPGAHPVGVGVGAAAGGMAAGAAVGTVAGPVGTAVGAAVGAIVGGLAGKSVAELVDPTLEDAYWRENFGSRPYVSPGASFDDYGPAFRYGVDAFNRQEGRTFSEAETDLSAGWHAARRDSTLEWDDARHATRDAWQRASDRVERMLPGDADRDGR
jgi:hypothetical protein